MKTFETYPQETTFHTGKKTDAVKYRVLKVQEHSQSSIYNEIQRQLALGKLHAGTWFERCCLHTW